MNILKNYINTVAKIVFATRMSRDTLKHRKFATYAFTCTEEVKQRLEPGDFVVVETKNGLQIGVFIEFSCKEEDANLASKPVVCTISDYTVDYEF